MKSKALLSAAIMINDLLAFDRNYLVDPSNHLPRGRTLSRDELLELLPGIYDKGITGGVLWFDGQMINSERLTLAFVLSAAGVGADVANYLEVTNFLVNKNRIVGVKATDILSDQEIEIRSRFVVNATGPWSYGILQKIGLTSCSTKYENSLAMNLVTRQFIPGFAAGIPSWPPKNGNRGLSNKSRMLFITPWRERSIVGTFHSHYQGSVDEFRPDEETIQHFVDETNGAYPDANLTIDDICHIHYGFLPEVKSNKADNVKLLREAKIYNHLLEDGIEGIISVIGVKYTSARKVAQEAVDFVFHRLGSSVPVCRTDTLPLYGGDIRIIESYLANMKEKFHIDLKGDEFKSLVNHYGSGLPAVLKIVEEKVDGLSGICDDSMVIQAQVIHAIRHEMAQNLNDVVFRRTDLGTSGLPNENCLLNCAEIMASELGWDKSRVLLEIDKIKANYTIL